MYLNTPNLTLPNLTKSPTISVYAPIDPKLEALQAQ
jgi:hypothetical protein